MKKTVFVTVAIGVIIIVLTLLFKLHHWYGADILLIFGTIFNFFIVLPLIAIYFFLGNFENKNLYLYGTTSAFILYAGMFCKLNHWAASGFVQIVGTVLFIIFVILLVFNLLQSPKE